MKPELTDEESAELVAARLSGRYTLMDAFRYGKSGSWWLSKNKNGTSKPLPLGFRVVAIPPFYTQAELERRCVLLNVEYIKVVDEWLNGKKGNPTSTPIFGGVILTLLNYKRVTAWMENNPAHKQENMVL